MNPGMTAIIFLKHFTGKRLRGAISKNSKKLSQRGCFFVYFDVKFGNNNNFFQRNTENWKFFKIFAKSEDVLAKQEIGRLRQEFPWESWKKWITSVN